MYFNEILPVTLTLTLMLLSQEKYSDQKIL